MNATSRDCSLSTWSELFEIQKNFNDIPCSIVDVRPFAAVSTFEVTAGGDVGIVAQRGTALVTVVISGTIVVCLSVILFGLIELTIDLIEDPVLNLTNPAGSSKEAEREDQKGQ